MTEGNDQVGWTDAQWNRVREEVQQAWQRVRVAGSFLPVYGPLPPSTQVVPSEIFNRNGTVDDQATANLLVIGRTPLAAGSNPSTISAIRDDLKPSFKMCTTRCQRAG